jgi:putative Holliday junction resolvase
MLRTVELAPLVRAGTGAAAASSSSSSQRVPLPRQGSAGAIRASPASGRSEGAGELPAPLLSNARRRGRDPLWHGGGFSLGVDLGDARTGLAVGRGITLPRPLTVRTP